MLTYGIAASPLRHIAAKHVCPFSIQRSIFDQVTSLNPDAIDRSPHADASRTTANGVAHRAMYQQFR